MNVRHFIFQKIIMDWLSLPELIFSDIMMMVGLESLESLHRCRQVCKTWNEMILRDIWESQTKKKIIKKRIEKNWGWAPGTLPSDEEISHAKWLGEGCCFLMKFTTQISPSFYFRNQRHPRHLQD